MGKAAVNCAPPPPQPRSTVDGHARPTTLAVSSWSAGESWRRDGNDASSCQALKPRYLFPVFLFCLSGFVSGRLSAARLAPPTSSPGPRQPLPWQPCRGRAAPAAARATAGRCLRAATVAGSLLATCWRARVSVTTRPSARRLHPHPASRRRLVHRLRCVPWPSPRRPMTRVTQSAAHRAELSTAAQPWAA